MKIKGKKAAAALLAVFVLAGGLAGCRSSEAVKVSADPDTAGSQEQDEAEAARTAALQADAEKGLLVLVNKENSVSESYKPDDLESIKYYAEDRDPQWRYMRSEAADAFHRMVEAARTEGIDFVMTTAYRSYGFQSILWNNAIGRYGTEEAANQMVAKPGQSEHQSGLAVDVSSTENDYQLTESFGDTQAGKWLAANAADYGFILRYAQDKTDVTGYGFEPWHFRYVGETAAKEISESGLALEEYDQQLLDEGILTQSDTMAEK